MIVFYAAVSERTQVLDFMISQILSGSPNIQNRDLGWACPAKDKASGCNGCLWKPSNVQNMRHIDRSNLLESGQRKSFRRAIAKQSQ